MTAKRRKRRSRPTLRARLRTFWIACVVAVAAVGYAGFAIATTPFFHVSSIAVTGLARVDEMTVVSRAAIDRHANVWLLDRASIARRIETIPYVRAAHVGVRPPASVTIDVTERTPEACVRDPKGRSATVDRDLRVLAAGCEDAGGIAYVVRTAPTLASGSFLRDPEISRLQNDAHELGATGDRYRSFSHDAFGELDATLASGITVRFGDDGDLDGKQRLVGPILAELGARARAVRAVDVRAPATPVVEYRPAGRSSPRPRPNDER